MVKLSRECNSHETLPSFPSLPRQATQPHPCHSYFFISLQKWCLAAELGFEKKGTEKLVFSLTNLHVGCTPARLTPLSTV